MTQSEAQRRAKEKYDREKVDRILLRLPKGKKALAMNHAKARGESFNGFVSRAIDEAIERDNRTD